MTNRLRHLLLSLSLLAAVLLAAVPTLGRIAQAQQVPDAATLAANFCGDAHAPLHRMLALWQKEQALRQPMQSPHGEHTPDCDYCPLLASLVALAFIALGVWSPGTRTFRLLRVGSAHLAFRHPSGLGSRGPPVTL